MNKLRSQLDLLSPEQRACLERGLLEARNAASEVSSGVRRRPGAGPCALSYCQQRLWFLEQLSPNTPTYNVPNALHIRGPLKVHHLENALRQVVRRHEILRTNYESRGGEPVQL